MAVCMAVITCIMDGAKACIKCGGTSLRILGVFLKMESPEKSSGHVKCAKSVYFL